MPKRRCKGVVPQDLLELWVFVSLSTMIGLPGAYVAAQVLDALGLNLPVRVVLLVGAIAGSWACSSSTGARSARVLNGR